MPSAPAKANQGVRLAGRPWNHRPPASAATAAPALMPSSPGSASGLRITVCATAPAAPSAAPANAAKTTRGARRSSTIIAEAGEEARSPLSAPSSSAMGIARSPIASEASASPTRAIANAGKRAARLMPAPRPARRLDRGRGR